jgi:hypothetical protein
MKNALIKLTSVSPYSQSRFHATTKNEKELHEDYESRTWMEKGWYDEKGFMQIPPMAIANSIKEAAKYLSIQIPGKGKSTYTKHFEAGILINDLLTLPVTRDTVRKNSVYANSDGVKGSGKRVMRFFPTCDKWSGEITVHIMDDIITRPVFEQVIYTAGSLIGIGQFRPRNGGYFGRYNAEIIEWQDI